MGRVFHLIPLLLLVCSSATLVAQDSAFVRKNIQTLTSDYFAGRSGCYDGEMRAAEYIADVLHNLSAQPLGEDGLQRYETPAHKMEGVVSISLDDKLLNPYTDYRIMPYSHSTHIQQVPIIRIKNSVLLDEEKCAQFIYRNSAVLPESFIYIEQQGKGQEETDALKKKIQALTSNNPFQSMGIIVGVDELPVWSLTYTDYERNYAVIYVLRSHFEKKVKSISADFDNKFFVKQTANVCFYIPGSQEPDSMVVLTAHFDHLGCMGDDVIFRGAHDNASGTSAVLDFARHYSQNTPAYTTVFLLFSGEESGLKGSRFFVEHPLVDLEKVKLLVNLDMFCGGEDGFTVVNYNDVGTQGFYDNLVRINEEKHYVKRVNPRVNAANSDHYFFSKKCPAIFIYTMGGRYGGYHNYTDTCERCGLECYHNIFSLLKEAIEQIH